MKNTFGSSITVTLFGESHGEAIGAVIDGISPGIAVDEDYIRDCLAKRRPSGKISTPRVEKDEFRILSGVFNGFTTGTPICIVIPNENTKSSDYSPLMPRPSHADYTAHIKYGGYEDYRGGGHFSGRITAALVAVGAILSSALAKKGIYIGTHIKRLGNILDADFGDYESDIKSLMKKDFPTLDGEKAEEMKSLAEKIASEGDSIGGIAESVVIGLPSGVGEPWFDSIESVLSHLLFSIPAIKGVEFGLGFGFADRKGSEANDEFATNGKQIFTKTNNNGGINGGISNGEPITFRCVVKPTPSIFKEQGTVRLDTMEECKLKLNGRHDPMIVHRACAVINAVTAIAVADMLAVKYGTDYFCEDKK